MRTLNYMIIPFLQNVHILLDVNGDLQHELLNEQAISDAMALHLEVQRLRRRTLKPKVLEQP